MANYDGAVCHSIYLWNSPCRRRTGVYFIGCRLVTYWIGDGRSGGCATADWGTGSGAYQEKVGSGCEPGAVAEAPIEEGQAAAGGDQAGGDGEDVAKRSTARRVTTSKVVAGKGFRRAAVCILTFVNVRARMTSRRKAVFLWLDSIRVREMCGAQSLMGMPGNPAPEPRSASGRWRLDLVVRRWPSARGLEAPAFFAPLGLLSRAATHGWRRGLHSVAARGWIPLLQASSGVDGRVARPHGRLAGNR